MSYTTTTSFNDLLKNKAHEMMENSIHESTIEKEGTAIKMRLFTEQGLSEENKKNIIKEYTFFNTSFYLSR